MSDPASTQLVHEPAAGQQSSIPEWDQNAPSAKTEAGNNTAQTASTRPSLKDRFDSVVPRDRTYLGLSRQWSLIAVLCITLALLGLIIGLAVGLTRHHGSGGKDLPLPSNRQQFVGDLTYYGTGLGSCGITSTDSQDIVAVSHIVFDAASTGSDPNSNPLCGQIIRATRYDGEVGADRSIDLKVVDRCTGCAADDLDVSPSAFASLAPIASGRVDVTWAWLSAAATST